MNVNFVNLVLSLMVSEFVNHVHQTLILLKVVQVNVLHAVLVFKVSHQLLNVLCVIRVLFHSIVVDVNHVHL